MRFIALKNKDVDMGLIPIALREYGFCDVAEDENELIVKVKNSLNSADIYKGIFLYPGKDKADGFQTLKKIRGLEAGRISNILVVFLCDEKDSINFFNILSSETESFISSKIVKREILELFINKKIINSINRGDNVRKNFGG